MRNQDSENRRFADYFAICGLDVNSGLEPDLLAGENLAIEPLLRPYKAKVLHHYPDNVAWNPFDKDAVHMLCFPKGLSFATSRQLGGRGERSIFHPFLITREDGSRIYGAAYTFYEEVTDKAVCDALATLQQMYCAELESCCTAESQSTGSAASDMEVNSTAKRRGSATAVTSYDMTRDRLLVSKCICVIMQKPFFHAAEQWLVQLHAAAVTASASVLSPGLSLSPLPSSCPPFPLESYVFNLLFEVPLPPTGSSMSFLAGRRRVVCHRPGALELPLLDLPFEEVFQLLGIDNVVSIFSSLLLEQRVMLYSSDYYRLVLVAECLSVALFPFTWQHVYVPILPASLRHFLDAPVPFVMGLHRAADSCDDNFELPTCEVCAVDIDGQKVELPEELPRFPYRQELADELATVCRQYGVGISGGSKCNLLDADSCESLHIGSGKDDSEGDDSGMNSHDEGTADSTTDSSVHCKFDVLHESETMTRIAEIAKKSGVIRSLEDFKQQFAHDRKRREEQRLMDAKDRQMEQKELNRLKFSNAIREVFFNRLLHMFSAYEKFIIPPASETTKDQWLHNRESMQNFDKKAFLCDQPDIYLPFICPFIETQMFATFIDNKILSQWDEPDLSIRVFDQRLTALLQLRSTHASASTGSADDGGASGQAATQLSYARCTSFMDSEAFIERRSEHVDLVAIIPHALDVAVPQREAVAESPSRVFQFPKLCGEAFRGQPQSGYEYEVLSKRWVDRKLDQLETLKAKAPQPQIAVLQQQLKDPMSRTPSKMYNINPSAVEETNYKFVTGLLIEIKAKTNKMVVNKMGLEAAALGHSLVLGLEESTLIASLCDLIERVWSHGLQHKQGKSPLWAHLMSYAEQADAKADRNKRIAKFKAVLPTQPTNGLADLQNLFVDVSDVASGSAKEKQGHARRSSYGGDGRARTYLEPLATGLLFDLGHVQRMTEIKTDVGKARAWIRLCLEKKSLARNLRELLADENLRKHMYKAYALLRHEEERDQTLLHLLSLSTADFFCFTNTFTNTVIHYRFLIIPGRRFPGGQSTTSANVWVTLSGHLLETARLWIPKNCFEFIYEGKNLGMLSTLRIGHDSGGLSPRWLVDCVLVRNETTGHIYKFPCGRWLGKGVDDDSTERILVGEVVSADGGSVCEPNVAALSLETAISMPVSSSASSAAAAARRSAESPKLVRSQIDRQRKLLSKSDLEQSLLDAVNGLVKFFWKPEKERGSVTVLLCADGGLVACLEAVFQHGFKASRLFRNNYYVWDYIEKVLAFLFETGTAVNHRSFCDRVQAVNGSSQNVGKDGKFQLLMCLAVRDHCVRHWLLMLATCPVTQQMYDDHAFIRDERAVRAVVGAVTSVSEFDISLEPSLTKGLQACSEWRAVDATPSITAPRSPQQTAAML